MRSALPRYTICPLRGEFSTIAVVTALGYAR